MDLISGSQYVVLVKKAEVCRIAIALFTAEDNCNSVCFEGLMHSHQNLWDIRNHDPPVKTHEQTPDLTHNDSYAPTTT